MAQIYDFSSYLIRNKKSPPLSLHSLYKSSLSVQLWEICALSSNIMSVFLLTRKGSKFSRSMMMNTSSFLVPVALLHSLSSVWELVAREMLTTTALVYSSFNKTPQQDFFILVLPNKIRQLEHTDSQNSVFLANPIG